MPDERQDSIRQGIHSPPESPSGAAAERERERRVAEDAPMEGAMGGSSDESRPGDEAQMNAARAASEAGDSEETLPEADEERLRDRSRTLRETREAGMRSQGGGSSEPEDIRRSAGQGPVPD